MFSRHRGVTRADLVRRRHEHDNGRAEYFWILNDGIPSCESCCKRGAGMKRALHVSWEGMASVFPRKVQTSHHPVSKRGPDFRQLTWRRKGIRGTGPVLAWPIHEATVDKASLKCFISAAEDVHIFRRSRHRIP